MKAIVTGHTHGLGAALARALALRGVQVLGRARGLSASLAAEFPGQVRQVALDLADSAALAGWLAQGHVAAFFEDCAASLLVNNAGTVQPIGPLPAQDCAEVGAAVALNVAAPLMLAAAVAALPGERRIAHVSSGAGRAPYAGWSVYCAGKAALDHHARAAALDAVPGLRVCSIAPGIVDTAMQAAIRASSVQLFPARARFIDLHRNGELADPATSAAKLVDYLLGENFAAQPVEDLRTLGP